MSSGALSAEDARLIASILGDAGNSIPSPSSPMADAADNVSKILARAALHFSF